MFKLCKEHWDWKSNGKNKIKSVLINSNINKKKTHFDESHDGADDECKSSPVATAPLNLASII